MAPNTIQKQSPEPIEAQPVFASEPAAHIELSADELPTEELLSVLPRSWDLLQEKVERITRRYIDCCNSSIDKVERPEEYYSFEFEDSLEQWDSVAFDLRKVMNKMTKLQLHDPNNSTYVKLLQAVTTMIFQWKTVRNSLEKARPVVSDSGE